MHKLKNMKISHNYIENNDDIYVINKSDPLQENNKNDKTNPILNEFLVKINDALNNPSTYKKLKKCLERCEKNWSNGGFVCKSMQKKNENNNNK